jgi:thymidylate synthase
VNRRTGVGVRTIPGGAALKVDLSSRLIPTIRTRRMFPKTPAAEVAWFLSGRRSTGWLSQHTKIWSKFTDEAGEVGSAYGWRWREHFGRDQLRAALLLLRDDPSSRHALVSTWDPAIDGLGTPSKATPCPAFFQLGVTGESLHMCLYMRSSDVMVGLPYDIMGFSLLLDAVAASLSLLNGSLTVFIGNAHVYDVHVEAAGQLLENMAQVEAYPDSPMPGWTMDGILRAPNQYVNAVAALASGLPVPAFSPKLEVVA